MIDDDRGVTKALADVFSWLWDSAWPLWLEHGVDRTRRGFHEELDLRNLRCGADFRRLRVAARQVFVFSAAHRAGLPGAAEAVDIGVDFLLRHARGEDGGYAQRFDLNGAVIDPTRDLYDHAFVLLAFASAADVLAKEPMQRHALELIGYVDRHFAHPAGGYSESRPSALPRRQNPHMHLLEACLAAAQSFGDDIFLRRAGELGELFLDRLLDPVTGTLPEAFDDSLSPLRDGGRHAVEPGHHSEWVWLLDWLGRLPTPAARRRTELDDASARLLRFVDRHGVNPRTGTLFDEVWSDGTPKAARSRLWPQTEWLKAAVLRQNAEEAGILAALRALARHLRAPVPGLWHERLDERGEPLDQPAPASSLYHLTAGILIAHRHVKRGAARDAF
ncbi:MAG: AGE family epimerase/isomerase [Roseomonas sp.]|nr:AGE family epimerase/isomerase [Roseomonas sp.]